MILFIKSQLDILIHWITERENIRILKAAGKPAPWTEDPLLAKWRWCNVNRCHDRETMWIFKNIIKAHEDDDALWFNLCLARFINWSPTLHKLGYFKTWDPERFCEVMSLLGRVGAKIYTGAYMIRGGTGEDAKVAKHVYLCNRVFNPLWSRRKETVHFKSCVDWDKFLGSIFGMGNFMRNQIITDLKYTNYLPFDSTADWTTFCLAGPGTTRGLNRLRGTDLRQQYRAEQANSLLRALRPRVVAEVDAKCVDYFNDLNNLANCLCEFDKYMRLTNGEGEPRSTYRPSADPLPY